MPTVTGLFVYPLKSARGIPLTAATLSDRGFEHDRRFMVVDARGHMHTQRDLPALARIETAIDGSQLVLRHEGHALALPLRPTGGVPRKVRVFRDEVDALALDEQAARFLTEALGSEVSLVYMPDRSLRQVDRAYARDGDLVGFADGFPYLLANEASVAELNRHLEAPIGMERFRPNIVIAGAAPYAEDSYRDLRIGEVSFVAAKLSSRCVITNTDQRTGERQKGVLEALLASHARDRKAMFGQNLLARTGGTLRVGDPVTVLPPG